MDRTQLREARRTLGLSARAFGEATGHTGRMVRFWEAGTHPVPVAAAEKAAFLLKQKAIHDAASPCPHEEIAVVAKVRGFSDGTVHDLDLSASCEICGKPINWLGDIPVGDSLREPTRSPDRRTLTLPWVAEGDTPTGYIRDRAGRKIK